MMKKKAKQIAAWICVIFLVLLYVATFISAVLDFPGSGAMFRSCLAATIGLPILLWIYLRLYHKIKEPSAMASFDLPAADPEKEENTLLQTTSQAAEASKNAEDRP